LADALVMLASAQLGVDPDPDRSTVVVHVPVGVLVGGEGGSGIEGGGVIDPPTARRLACSGRLQAVVEDASGNVVRLGRIRRDPPSWMVRQLRYRDGGCRFPGCGTRRFTHAHHITWWERGGATSLENLILLCSFHHKLVHEYGWTVRRGSDGAFRWFRPEGAMYRAGPGPPGQKQLPESVPERAVPAA
jgi:hypothetical protein